MQPYTTRPLPFQQEASFIFGNDPTFIMRFTNAFVGLAVVASHARSYTTAAAPPEQQPGPFASNPDAPEPLLHLNSDQPMGVSQSYTYAKGSSQQSLAYDNAGSHAFSTKPDTHSNCDDICKRLKNGYTITSIGSTIVDHICNYSGPDDPGTGGSGGIHGGRYEVIKGPPIDATIDGFCGVEPSIIWELWAKSYVRAFPSRLDEIPPDFDGSGSGKILISAATLARFTSTATNCYNRLNGKGGERSKSYAPQGPFI